MLGPALDHVSAILSPYWQRAKKRTDRLIFGNKEHDPATTWIRSFVSLILFIFPGFFLIIFVGSMDETGFLFPVLYLIWSVAALVLFTVIGDRQLDAEKRSANWSIRKRRWFGKSFWYDDK